MKLIITMTLLLAASSTDGQWRNIGRGHPDGRDVIGDLAIGVHDSYLFVSNYDVGVWRYTIDGGWHPANDGVDFTQGTVTSFSSLGRYVFAGMSYGRGPGSGWRSSDDGSNWMLNGGGNVCVTASYVLWAADGIYRSRDSGADNTYTKVTDFAAKNFAAIGACILAFNASGAQRSTDSGTTWTSLSVPSFIELKAFTSMGDFAFAGDSGVSRSIDSGLTWSRIALQNRYVKSLASTDRYLFAGTDSGVFVSLDTGITWRWVSEGMGARPGHNPDVQMLAVMDSFLYAYVDAGDWGLPDPNGRYSYTTGRPIREMIDTTHSAVNVSLIVENEPILVYPNPTPGFFTIESPDRELRSVVVLNLLGQELQRLGNVGRDAQLARVDLAAFASGTYYLRIETDKGVVMKKIVRE